MVLIVPLSGIAFSLVIEDNIVPVYTFHLIIVPKKGDGVYFIILYIIIFGNCFFYINYIKKQNNIRLYFDTDTKNNNNCILIQTSIGI